MSSLKTIIKTLCGVAISVTAFAESVPQLNTKQSLANMTAQEKTEVSRFGFLHKNKTPFDVYYASENKVLQAVEVGGMAIVYGDVIAGRVEDVRLGQGRSLKDIMREPQANVRHSDGAFIWPNGVIPYEFGSTLDSQSKGYLQNAMAHISSKTNVRFVPRTNQTDYIYAHNGGGCSSWAGTVGGKQFLSMTSLCSYSAAIHELGHAAGFNHEHQRSDRDQYITIHTDQIQQNYITQFDKIPSTEGRTHGAYDYYSVMHYADNAFAIGNSPVWTYPSHVDGSLVGVREDLSPGDIAGYNYMYPSGGTNENPSADNCTTDNAVLLEDNYTATLNMVGREAKCFKFYTGAQTPNYTVTTAGGGDIDIYSRTNAIPNRHEKDYISDNMQSDEVINGYAISATVYVKVYSWVKSSNVSLNITFDSGAGGGGGGGENLCTGSVVNVNNNYSNSLSLTANQHKCYKIVLPSNVTEYTVSANGNNGDLDLFTGRDGVPSATSFDCSSTLPNAVESCVRSTTTGGDLYARIFAYSAFNNATISISYKPAGGGGGNTAPNANFTHSANNLAVSFSDSSTDDSGVTSRSWDFGDGQTSSSTNPSHTYASAGTYSVQLTVNDAQGLSDSTTKSVTVTDGGGGGNTPELLTPAPGSTLSGSSQTFTWNKGNATAVWIYAGDAVGSSSYKSSGSQSGTSYNMTGLPTDGSTVYVRFWYNDGSWKNEDHTYTAANGGGGGNTAPNANFTHSANNLAVSFSDFSTDDSGVTSRSWNFGDGQTSSSTNPSHTYASAGTYSVQLTVNDAQGLSDSTTKSVTVTDGGGGGGNTPELLTPAPGSTLSGSSQTFTWNKGNATAVWIYAGDAVGSSSYKSSGSQSGTSYNMTGLPTDGSTVYVRFWYNDGSWKNEDHTYNAANGGGGGGTGGSNSMSGNMSSSNTEDYGAQFTAGEGTITAHMTGASGTDFELGLERKSGSSWTSVATSTQSTSTESISYNATAGTYRVKAYRYSGTGSYTVNWTWK